MAGAVLVCSENRALVRGAHVLRFLPVLRYRVPGAWDSRTTSLRTIDIGSMCSV